MNLSSVVASSSTANAYNWERGGEGGGGGAADGRPAATAAVSGSGKEGIAVAVAVAFGGEVGSALNHPCAAQEAVSVTTQRIGMRVIYMLCRIFSPRLQMFRNLCKFRLVASLEIEMTESAYRDVTRCIRTSASIFVTRVDICACRSQNARRHAERHYSG